MKTLFAGPFVGEFGHELFCFQGHVRWKSQQEDFERIVVASRPGHEALYKDFCTNFVPYTPNSNKTGMSHCENFVYNPKIHEKFLEITQEELLSEKNQELELRLKNESLWLKPNVKHIYYNTKWRDRQPKQSEKWEDPNCSFHEVLQSFIKYGSNSNNEKKYDFIIHARSTKKYETNLRNWPISRWEQLLGLIRTARGADTSVASVGTKDAAAHIQGTDDLRGIPLENLCNVLHNAKAILGSSSGPMHLASLCGCPQVVWSEGRNEIRYKNDWNPFNTPVQFISSWQPAVLKVFSRIQT
jgi:hypothetical protein